MSGSEPQNKDEHDESSLVKGLFAGVVVGGVAAWLLAPRRGAQMRAWLHETVYEQLAKTRSTFGMILPGEQGDKQDY